MRIRATSPWSFLIEAIPPHHRDDLFGASSEGRAAL